ncbi:SGNH/GDSL hydrolase family protein [Streptomyces sp. HUAS TT20]|uniref:SGNH/GDSL hydrolase family protein n=1 Tax=Streptomyces sp. HUAS TT20 TaxID=3447509 RepID=UPI0021DA3E0A|nr:SGNH/GDSL hydrolase family protein [Streptomyces sp. HUAS 15-9]UXY25765.1 SGNH/GDSL hydrolase family protein [Streptomyces sp. HUAS 15-9]
MKNSVRAGLAGVLACGVIGTAIGIVRDDGGSGDDSTPSKGPYVALGDSYTSGPRIPDRTGTPAGCERSDRNYPTLVARRLGLDSADFDDVSCSGATIADLSAAQSTDDGVNPPQLSALSARTRLITVGIGANDIDFIGLIKRCVTAGAVYFATGSGTGSGGENLPGDAPCRAQYVSGDTDEVRQRTETAERMLSRTLGEVKRRAPHARVHVVAYPAILPADGHGCGREMGLAPGDVTFLREKEQQLNAMLRRRAEAAGAGYVDTYEPSEGHDACSASATRWIEPLVPASPAASVHPNERGERGMAAAVLDAMGAVDAMGTWFGLRPSPSSFRNIRAHQKVRVTPWPR